MKAPAKRRRKRPAKRRRRLSPDHGRHKQQAREKYYAVLLRYQAWCAARGKSFYVQIYHFCRRQMGESRRNPPPHDQQTGMLSP